MNFRNYLRLISVLFLSGCLLPPPLPAQIDPGAAEDAEAERRKILKAADQVDRMDAAVEDPLLARDPARWIDGVTALSETP